MEQKTKILIVDDNAQIRSCLRGILEGNEQLQVIGEAVDGVEALDKIGKHKPDVVLLDIVMPNLDGFGVLEAMRDKSDAPLFIMVSALSQEGFVLRAIEMGATYFIAKPFDVTSIRNRIKDCVAIKSGKISERVATVSQIGGRSFEKTVDEKLSTMFITIGIPAHIKGYNYLREAVKMVMNDPNIINSITKELYPGIAKTFQTSASKVERAIRHAIEVAWTRGKIENINEIFGYNVYSRNDKPTNGEFIALLADKLNLEKAA